MELLIKKWRRKLAIDDSFVKLTTHEKIDHTNLQTDFFYRDLAILCPIFNFIKNVIGVCSSWEAEIRVKNKVTLKLIDV